ncbi:MAG: phage holin family protein [Marmoricola sp.]
MTSSYTPETGSTAAPFTDTPVPPQRGDATGTEDTRSLGAIVGDISADVSALMRQEVELAKTELKQEATRLGKGAGMLGGAGFAGYMTVLFLSLTLTFVLDIWLPLWAGALITAGIWAVAAAVLAMRGRTELKEANPDLPETRQTLKEDVQWAKAQKN